VLPSNCDPKYACAGTPKQEPIKQPANPIAELGQLKLTQWQQNQRCNSATKFEAKSQIR